MRLLLDTDVIVAAVRSPTGASAALIALCDPVYRAYRWRPQLRDPADEMVLEAAVNGSVDMLVTFNRRDFGTAPAAFGIACLLPREALERIRS